jgi:hypothetical protein
MRFRALGVVVASLLILAQAPGQVEQMPPQEAFAVLGGPVAAPDGKTIGRLVDVLVDGAGMPQAAVIDFGGFMGVGARKVAVHWSTLHFSPADVKQPITLDLTADQIKGAPEYRNPGKPASVVVQTQASAVGPVSPVSGAPASEPSEQTTSPGPH